MAVFAVVYLPATMTIGIHVVTRSLKIAGLCPEAPRVLIWEKILIAAALGGLVLLVYGHFVEPFWIEVTRVKIESPKLTNHQRPIRVVQISDLHCDPEMRVEERLPGIIKAEAPDVIVFTGDTINSKAGLDVFRKCMSQVSTIAPTYAVMGNHDARCWSDLNLFKNSKAVTLNGDSKKLNIHGQELYLAGVAFDSESLIDQALSAIPQGKFTLFLYHSPDLVMELAQRPIDLVCAGHTHGGQVCLPWYGAIVTQSKFGKQLERGLHRIGDTWLYVNRGIGMEGGINPRVRFLARPEVTVIELEPEKPEVASK